MAEGFDYKAAARLIVRHMPGVLAYFSATGGRAVLNGMQILDTSRIIIGPPMRSADGEWMQAPSVAVVGSENVDMDRLTTAVQKDLDAEYGRGFSAIHDTTKSISVFCHTVVPAPTEQAQHDLDAIMARFGKVEPLSWIRLLMWTQSSYARLELGGSPLELPLFIDREYAKFPRHDSPA